MQKGTAQQLEKYLTIKRVFLGREDQYISVEVAIKALNQIINNTDPRSKLSLSCKELLQAIIMHNTTKQPQKGIEEEVVRIKPNSNLA